MTTTKFDRIADKIIMAFLATIWVICMIGSATVVAVSVYALYQGHY